MMVARRGYGSRKAGEYAKSWRSSSLPGNWAAIRRVILIRDRGMCLWGLLPDDEPGYELGSCNVPATDVDHIGKSWEHDEAHLRSLCSDHHRKRTSRQANAARAAKLKANGGNLRARSDRGHPGAKPV